jgi:hypothetical protein
MDITLSRAELPDRVDEVTRERPVAIVCGSGYRMVQVVFANRATTDPVG